MSNAMYKITDGSVFWWVVACSNKKAIAVLELQHRNDGLVDEWSDISKDTLKCTQCDDNTDLTFVVDDQSITLNPKQWVAIFDSVERSKVGVSAYYMGCSEY